MEELKSYKGVVIFVLILTIVNFMPIGKDHTTEYVKGNTETQESEVAVNI